MSRPLSSPPTTAPAGDLARLLETERRLEDEVASAREEAARLVHEASANAARDEQALEAELARAEDQLQDEIVASVKREREALLSAAREKAARSAAIADERVNELAEYLVRRLLGEEPAP